LNTVDGVANNKQQTIIYGWRMLELRFMRVFITSRFTPYFYFTSPDNINRIDGIQETICFRLQICASPGLCLLPAHRFLLCGGVLCIS